MIGKSELPRPSPGYLENCRWIDTHINELMRQYPDQWIAVYGGRLLAGGPDLGRVTNSAKEITSSDDVAYEFLASATMIL